VSLLVVEISLSNDGRSIGFEHHKLAEEHNLGKLKHGGDGCGEVARNSVLRRDIKRTSFTSKRRLTHLSSKSQPSRKNGRALRA
jgi:hypothetical protein